MNKSANNIVSERSERRIFIGLCLFLVAGVAAVYLQTVAFGFVDYDDPFYVTRNPQVLAGLTWDGVKWAFTTMHAANWFPLVWLSLMLDKSLFGAGAAGFHLVNVALHIANTLMLFWVLKRYTKSLWPGFFIAAVFGLHPLHVESVAWITERKDTLSTLFWLLTMLAYIRYVEIPAARRYVIVCAVFVLGLMSKSMLVTLPFVLLLMDYWPLERIGEQNISLKRLIIEKIPLLILSACVCIVTIIAQKNAGAVSKIDTVPFDLRLVNAIVSYCVYLFKTFWPVGLAVYYPYPINAIAGWKIAVSLAVLLSITIVVILFRHRRYLLVGWFWFLGTLVPVIGFVQVGSQSMADRYTYIPLTGIFIILVWLARDLVVRHRFRQIPAGLVGFVIISVLGVMSFVQAGFWRDTVTLFEHCAAVTPDNVVVHMYLGTGFAEKGDAESALREFEKALKFEPNDPRTFYNIGVMMISLGRTDEAIGYYNRALELKPGDAATCAALATIWQTKGNVTRAIDIYRQAVKYNPLNIDLRGALALVLLQSHRLDEAIIELEQIIKTKPDSSAYCNLGIAWAKKGQIVKSAQCYLKSIQLDPDNAKAHYNFGNLLLAQNKTDEAIAEYRTAIRIMPDYALAHAMLAATLSQMEKNDDALKEYRRALEIDPNNKDARAGLEKIRALQKSKPAMP